MKDAMASPAEKIDLGLAAARLHAAAARLTPKERRRFRRMPVVVAGRMLESGGREFDCRTADISPGDVRIAASALPDVNAHVVLYLNGFGRLSGHVARRCGEDEVAIIFDTSAHKREKMAEALTWTVNKDVLGLDDGERRATRHEAKNGPALTQIELESGVILEGEVLDFSLAGMTIRTAKSPPPIGAWVRAGGLYGRVARRIDGGFAIDFEPRGARPRTIRPIDHG
jgi:hypothetical protein